MLLTGVCDGVGHGLHGSRVRVEVVILEVRIHSFWESRRDARNWVLLSRIRILLG